MITLQEHACLKLLGNQLPIVSPVLSSLDRETSSMRMAVRLPSKPNGLILRSKSVSDSEAALDLWAGNVRAAGSTDADDVDAFNPMLLSIRELLPFGRF